MLVAAGDAAHSPTPAAEFALKEYGVVADEGLGSKDFSAVFRYLYGSGCDNEEVRGREEGVSVGGRGVAARERGGREGRDDRPATGANGGCAHPQKP